MTGAALPDLVRTIDLPRMVAYAGATWDWHRLHYDLDYVRGRGLDRPVVDGQLLGALLAEHAQDGLGAGAFITRMEFRFAAMVFAGDAVTVRGEVTAREGDTVVVTQQVLVGVRTCIRNATSTVRIGAGS